MTTTLHRCRLVLTLGLLAVALPARAADFDKYLLDDANGVITVNVKQALAAPLYAKNFQKQAEGLLQRAEIQALLKDTGFDPLKDIERVTVVLAPSGESPEGDFKNEVSIPHRTPLVILQGNLDSAKLKAVLERTATALGMKVQEQKAGQASYLEASVGRRTYYFAVPEKGTVVFSAVKDHVTAALEKGAGMKKTQLKNKELPGLLAKLDLKATVSWAATGDMVVATIQRVTFSDVGKKIELKLKGGDKDKCGENDDTKVNIKHHRLADQGITAALGSATAADDLKAQTVLTFKDADRARQFGELAREQVKKGIDALDQLAKVSQEYGLVRDTLKTVQIRTQEQTVTLEGQVKAETLEATIQLYLQRK